MIRLVAYDLDGTLVGRDLVLRPRVREAVARAGAAGVKGCIVTGRMYQATLPYVRELELDAPVVCYQGAAIIDPQTDEALFDLPLSNAVVHEIITIAQRDHIHLQLFRNDVSYCEQQNRYAELFAHICGVKPVIVRSLAETFQSSDSTKALFIADPSTAQAYVTRLREELGACAYVTRSYAEYIEVLNPLVDKGEALRFITARLGLTLAETLAIGDSWNDIPLLRAAGIGVAMGNAPQELQTLADLVVSDVEHDGVADALARFAPGTSQDDRPKPPRF